jgi:ABC-type nitrate/sulfonate/bicarbonate transport system permease component
MARSGHTILRGAAGILPPTVACAAFLVLWEVAVRLHWVPATIAPPTKVLAILIAERGLLWFHAEPTLLTAMVGFLAAALLAFTIALAVHAYRRLEVTVLTVGAVLDSVPIIALAPILILWLGLSLTTRMAISAVICFFPILVSLLQGLNAIPRNVDELFQVLAATPFQRFRLLALPHAVPYLFIGLKIAAPLSLLGALIGESTGAEWGLGVFMLNAMFSLQVDQLWASVVISCLLSAAAYGLVCLFEHLILPAAPKQRGA